MGEYSSRQRPTPDFLVGGKEKVFSNIGLIQDEPVLVSSNKNTDAFNIANHLVFQKKYTGGIENDVVNTNSPHTVGTSYSKYLNTKTVTMIRNHSQRKPETRTMNRDLQPSSQTIGPRSGQLYIREGQHNSGRRHVGTGAFFRRTVTERKEDLFTFFDIETDNVNSYQYRPGEDVCGTITTIVRKAVEVRYVELVVTGQGHITLRRSRDGMPETLNETYLNKQSYVIGSGDSEWKSLLTPGQYTSKFRVKLPVDLPSSTQHEDARNGLSVNIQYSLTARICDDVINSAHNTVQPGLVKVILRKKISFNVQRAFDLSLVPDATSPVSRSEHVFLSCTHSDAAHVSLRVDRAVCLAGDDVRLSLTTTLPSTHRFKDITCTLQEHVTLVSKTDPTTFALSRMIRKDPANFTERLTHSPSSSPPHQRQQEGENNEENTFDVTLPTQTSLLSPHTVVGSQLKLTYSLDVQLRITPAGGKMAFNVPLEIGPCADPIYAEKTSSRKVVPLFNRPTRFPCFSSHATPSSTTLSRPSSAQSSRSALITTKYTNNILARCLLCCMTATDD